MIISFGGASAIGKTTLCQSFSDTHFIVPEVNILFAQEESSGKLWYYEKQVERFQLAKSSDRDAIFDGDIFQPIWYNWIYGYPKEFASKEETHSFYLEKIKENQIAFPDLYIIFFTSVENLKFRKENDQTRRRRNFEKHLQLIKPHRAYFDFLKKETSIPVEFVEYNDFETTKQKVIDLMDGYKNNNINTLSEFDKILEWINA